VARAQLAVAADVQAPARQGVGGLQARHAPGQLVVAAGGAGRDRVGHPVGRLAQRDGAVGDAQAEVVLRAAQDRVPQVAVEVDGQAVEAAVAQGLAQGLVDQGALFGLGGDPQVALAAAQQRIAQAGRHRAGGAAQVQGLEVLADAVVHPGGGELGAQARRMHAEAVGQGGLAAAVGARDAGLQQVLAVERSDQRGRRADAPLAGVAVVEVVRRRVQGPGAAGVGAHVQAAGAGLVAAFQRRAGLHAGHVVDQQQGALELLVAHGALRQRRVGDGAQARREALVGAAHGHAVTARLQAAGQHRDLELALGQ
ncbi:conserved hypothetical protein, partial [Ricinus communis]